MPTPLQIHIKAGADAGRTLLLRESPITFGRSAENTLTIDLPFLSREHAELRYEEERAGGGRWVLVNHSPNGTRLDGRAVGSKPRPITAPATVSVGDEDVLEVVAEMAAAGVGAGAGGQGSLAQEGRDREEAEEERAAAARGPVRGRGRLWLAIVLWNVAMLLGLGIVAMFWMGDGGGDGKDRPTPLTMEQIAAEVRRPLEPRPPDERRVSETVLRANHALATREAKTDALYDAHRRYQEAIAYTPGGERLTNPLEFQKAADVERELIERLQTLYRRGLTMLDRGQYAEAASMFREVYETYPDQGSEVFRSAQRLRAFSRRQAERKR